METVASAITLIKTHSLDAAFLDIILGAEKSFPIAEKLDGLNVPLAFVSVYTSDDIPAKFRKDDLLPKPLPAMLMRKQLLKVD